MVNLFSFTSSFLFGPVFLTKNWGSVKSGVKSYDVSLDTQTADVVTEESLTYETVLEKIKKTGKEVKSGEADGIAMSV